MQNMDWIKQRQNAANCKNKEFAQTSDCSVPSNIQNKSAATKGDTNSGLIDNNTHDILCLNKVLLLGDLVDVLPSPNNKTFLQDSVLFVSEKCFLQKDMRKKTIYAYVKKLAILYVSSEISAIGAAMSLCPKRIEFKNLTGWMDCNQATEKVMCLNFKIVQLPQDLRKYIITHAFCHFVENNHGDSFWHRLKQQIPNYTQCQDKLKEYQFLLDIL